MKRGTMAVSLLLAAACASPAADSASLVYTLELREGPLWSPGAPATAAAPGDTVTVAIDLYGTTAGRSTLAHVHADCAANATVLRGTVTVAVLPDPVTCPDSSFFLLIGPDDHLITRRFNWVVPAGATPGTYTVRSELLLDPPRQLARAIQVP